MNEKGYIGKWIEKSPDLAYDTAGRVIFGGLKMYALNYPFYDRVYQRKKEGERVVLLPDKAITEVKVDKYDTRFSKLLSRILRAGDAKQDVHFVKVKDVDVELEDANLEDVRQQLRGRGFEFCKDMATEKGPGGFYSARRPFISVWDLALGAEHIDLEKPYEGFESFAYALSEYPFKEGSPSETAVFWPFFSGASEILHGTSEEPKGMETLVRHKWNHVSVDCHEKGY